MSYNALIVNVDDLPDDPALLKRLLAERTADRERITALETENRTLSAGKRALEADIRRLELDKLRMEVELLRLRKWYYGRRADDLTHFEDAAQLVLEFAGQVEALPPAEVEDVEAVADDATPVDLRDVELTSVRTVRRGRRDLAGFDDLPVIRRTHDLPEADKPCPCCGQERTKIGESTSWQLEYIPGHFERVEHVRLKYACAKCEADAAGPQIVLADKPPQPIDRGLPGPGLLAFVVSSKFADYLPLYRLEDLFARSGVDVRRATMSVWCRDVADLVRPLHELMVKRVLGGRLVCTDDTTMPMLSPGAGKTKTGRMGVYVGDEANPYDVFDFTTSRSRDGPAAFLKDFTGTLLADGYGGYDGVVTNGNLTRAGCWAHARRKFVDAEKSQPQVAREAVTLIGRLYDVERRAKAMNAADRLAMRQTESKPVLDTLHERLSAWKLQLLPKHPMSEAVGYTLRQWRELNVFASDGAVPLDNNVSEREMKRIVLGRKNSLFVGNERGGRTAAVLAGLLSTCRRHGIDPQRYLTQLLTNLPATPISRLDQWLPDQWKKVNDTPKPTLTADL